MFETTNQSTFKPNFRPPNSTIDGPMDSTFSETADISTSSMTNEHSSP
jgi:hypothetical protein